MNIEELKSKVASLTDKIPFKGPQLKSFCFAFPVFLLCHIIYFTRFSSLFVLPLILMCAIWAWRESIVTLIANRFQLKVPSILPFFAGLLLALLACPIFGVPPLALLPLILIYVIFFFHKPIYKPINLCLSKISNSKAFSNIVSGCVVWTLTESILVLVTLIILSCIPKEVCYVQLLVDSGLYFFLFPIYIVIPLFVSFILRAEWAIRKSGILGWRKCLLVTLVIWSIFIAIDLMVMNSISKKYQKDFKEKCKEAGRAAQMEFYRSMRN